MLILQFLTLVTYFLRFGGFDCLLLFVFLIFIPFSLCFLFSLDIFCWPPFWYLLRSSLSAILVNLVSFVVCWTNRAYEFPVHIPKIPLEFTCTFWYCEEPYIIHFGLVWFYIKVTSKLIFDKLYTDSILVVFLFSGFFNLVNLHDFFLLPRLLIFPLILNCIKVENGAFLHAVVFFCSLLNRWEGEALCLR